MPRIELDIRAQVTRLSKDLKKTQAELTQLQKKSDQTNKRMQSGFNKSSASLQKFAGYFGIAFGGAMVLRGLTKQIDLMKEFEKTMANVFTLLSDAQKKRYGDFLPAGAAQIIGKYGLAVQDVNKALFDTISAGIDAGDSIKFLDEAAKLAIGGVTDLSTAVDGMTSVINAYGLAIEDANAVANAFFTAQKFGKTTVAELAQNIGMVAPVAKMAGVSFQETLSALALLTKQGIQTDLATTALRATLVALTSPTKQSAAEFKKLGIETGITAIQEVGLAETLLKVAQATKTNKDKMTELIPNVRALVGVAALGEKALAEFDIIVKAVNEDIGESSSLAGALGIQMETLATKTDIASGAWKNFMLSLKTQSAKGAYGEILTGWAWLLNTMAEKNREIQEEMTLGSQKMAISHIADVKQMAEETGESIESIINKRLDIFRNVMRQDIETMKEGNREQRKIAQKDYFDRAITYRALVDLKEETAKEIEKITKDQIEGERILDEKDFKEFVALEKLRIQTIEDDATKEIAIEELKHKIALDKYKGQNEFLELEYERHLMTMRKIEQKYDILKKLKPILPPIVIPIEELKIELAEVESVYKAHLDRLNNYIEDFGEDQTSNLLRGLSLASGFVNTLSEMNQIRMNRELIAAKDNEQKKEAIAREYAKKEQRNAILRATISGAEALVKNWGQWGTVVGSIMNILQIALTAAQIGVIASQKFAKGGYDVLSGKRHHQGGVQIPIGEAEEGEGHAVFSRKATRKFKNVLPELVKSINQGAFPVIDLGTTERLGKKEDIMRHMVSLDDSKQLEAIRLLLAKDKPNIYYENGYRIEESKGLIRRIKLK